MSPIAAHGRGLPSTPVTVSAHGRAFTKSRMSGCMWYVHPLSTTKPMCLSCLGRPRTCRSLRRAARVASSARGCDEMFR
eukprot:1157116-Pleurochrysis_carterae.AAC.1